MALWPGPTARGEDKSDQCPGGATSGADNLASALPAKSDTAEKMVAANINPFRIISIMLPFYSTSNQDPNYAAYFLLTASAGFHPPIAYCFSNGSPSPVS